MARRIGATNRKLRSHARPNQRPPIKHNLFRRNELICIELARDMAEKLGEDHPAVKRLLELECQIAAGRRSARYVGFELRAIMDLLDRAIGKPRQPIEHSGKVTYEELVLGAGPVGRSDA